MPLTTNKGPVDASNQLVNFKAHNTAEPIPKPTRFMGTENLLELTVIAPLMHRHISRQELDSLAGGGNGLALISDLRDKGLTVNCDRIDFIDNDGNPFSTDVFSFTDRCKRMVNAWLAKRKTGSVT